MATYILVIVFYARRAQCPDHPDHTEQVGLGAGCAFP
jgi:hypothetical protein